MIKLTRRAAIASVAALGLAATAAPAMADGHKMTFTLATSGSETDQRSVAMANVFAPMVAEFAEYQPGYNGTLFAQGTELEAIAGGNLTMSIASAQELAQFFPAFSIFATGYVHQDAAHQVRVFNDPLMDPFKKTVEDELGVEVELDQRSEGFQWLVSFFVVFFAEAQEYLDCLTAFYEEQAEASRLAAEAANAAREEAEEFAAEVQE